MKINPYNIKFHFIHKDLERLPIFLKMSIMHNGMVQTFRNVNHKPKINKRKITKTERKQIQEAYHLETRNFSRSLNPSEVNLPIGMSYTSYNINGKMLFLWRKMFVKNKSSVNIITRLIFLS